MTRVSIPVLIALSLLTAPATALKGASSPRLPSADSIINQYIEATGGREALGRVKTRLIKGRMELATLGAGGAFQSWSKAPNKQCSTMDLVGFGSIREGFDGKVAWSSAPLQGTRVKEGEELARVQRTTLFPRELKLREAYPRFETKGEFKIGDTNTWIVEATPATGKPDRLYFDQKTGLLVREESTVSSFLGDIVFQVDFADYREVDGVKVPFSMRMPKPAELNVTIVISEVTHNLEIPDSQFSKPAK